MPGFAPVGSAPVGAVGAGAPAIYHAGAGAVVAHAVAVGNLNGINGQLKVAAMSAAFVTLTKPAVFVAGMDAAFAILKTSIVQSTHGTITASAVAHAVGQVRGAVGAGAVAAHATVHAVGDTREHKGVGEVRMRAMIHGAGFYHSDRGAGSVNATALVKARGNFTKPFAPGSVRAVATIAGRAKALYKTRGAVTAHATVHGVAQTNAGAGRATATAVVHGVGSASYHTSGVVTTGLLYGRTQFHDALLRGGGYAVTADITARFTARATFALGIVIRDKIKIALGSSPIWTMHMTTFGTMTFRDAVHRQFRSSLSDNLTLTSNFYAKLVLQIIDRILLHPQLFPQAEYKVSVTAGMTLRDLVVQAFGLHLADAVQLAATLTPIYKAIITAIDAAEISGTLAPVLAISGVIRDDVALDAVFSPQQLMHVAVMDLIMLDMGAAEPNDTLSIWQMNTRTAAVTEYGNYPFNSFGRLNTAIYIGASDDGLYELTGPDDEGSPIVAVLRGGYLQFGSTHLSRIKAAYVAVRGSGEMLLKIVTGPGEEYIYSANTQSMQSTKFQMGKGQRARYFAWELTSVGQDFDLDTLEFVPIEVQRRV